MVSVWAKVCLVVAFMETGKTQSGFLRQKSPHQARYESTFFFFFFKLNSKAIKRQLVQ